MNRKKNKGGNAHDRAVAISAASKFIGPLAEATKLDKTPMKSTPLQWLRGIGAVSILLGGFGLMQTFYWPSVISIYIGFAVLLVDLWFDQSGFGIKTFIASAIFAAAFSFTSFVTLRENPFVASYRMHADTLEMILENDSDDDYYDIDMKIRPDQPSIFVSDPHQLSSLPNVSFLDTVPFISNTKDESVEATLDMSHPEAEPTYKSNYLRFRCDRLPYHSALRISIKLTRQVLRHDDAPVFSVSKVDVDGVYRGKFRIFKITAPAVTVPAFPM